jgi:hypothetical protein
MESDEAQTDVGNPVTVRDRWESDLPPVLVTRLMVGRPGGGHGRRSPSED